MNDLNKDYLQVKFKTIMTGKIRIIFILLSLLLFACSQEEKRKQSIDDIFKLITEDVKPESAPLINQIEIKKSIKIATILPITGSYSLLGEEGVEVIQMFRNLQSSNKIDIQVFNTDSNDENIEKIANAIKNDDFDVIIGPIFNHETEALAEIETKKPIISLSNDITIYKPNVITFGVNQDDKIVDAVSFFTNRNKLNFITLLPNSSNGSRFYNSIKNTVNINSGNIMRAEFYDNTGNFGVSKYVYKVLNGLSEKSYILNETGERFTEREIKIMQEKSSEFKIENYEVEQKNADVIFILGSSNLDDIINILNEPKNQVKLANTIVLFIDGDISKINYYKGKGMFYQEKSQQEYNFIDTFTLMYGKRPSNFAYIMHDAISYAIYVNNNTIGGLTFKDLKAKTKNFQGLAGSFVIRENNSTSRIGKMMQINQFDIEYEGEIQEEKSTNIKFTPIPRRTEINKL